LISLKAGLWRRSAKARCRVSCERQEAPAGFVAPIWVPWAGFVSSVVLLILDVVLMV
jgi:hypothetical protein